MRQGNKSGQKKLLLLGGSRYLIPVIKAAQGIGLYVITSDYLPENIAHRYSDEYHNVSIIEKDAVLELAQNMGIDGVMSFACDPGVVSAAYVAEKMGLSFQMPYESAKILQDKGLFRKFLWDHGFNCPHARSYGSVAEALADRDYFDWPVIVKPVDSAGSKGVTRVEDFAELEKAIRCAVSESHNVRFIVEDFITFKGCHSSADDFTINGNLVFCTYSDQLFDGSADNPYTPSLIIWPSSMEKPHQETLTKETQRLMRLLHAKTGIYNIESCVGLDGKPYLMEVSPRGGGCKIAEIQHLATGTNLIEAEIRQAIGEEVEGLFQPEFEGVWCEMVVHNGAGKSGYFEKLEIDAEIREKYVRLVDMSAMPGDYVEPFTGANKSFGDVFLRFGSREELNDIMGHSNEWMRIRLSR